MARIDELVNERMYDIPRVCFKALKISRVYLWCLITKFDPCRCTWDNFETYGVSLHQLSPYKFAKIGSLALY